MSFEYDFNVFYFYSGSSLGTEITKHVADKQKEGWEYEDVKFAQSSASGTGMSAIVVMRRGVQ